MLGEGARAQLPRLAARPVDAQSVTRVIPRASPLSLARAKPCAAKQRVTLLFSRSQFGPYLLRLVVAGLLGKCGHDGPACRPKTVPVEACARTGETSGYVGARACVAFARIGAVGKIALGSGVLPGTMPMCRAERRRQRMMRRHGCGRRLRGALRKLVGWRSRKHLRLPEHGPLEHLNFGGPFPLIVMRDPVRGEYERKHGRTAESIVGR